MTALNAGILIFTVSVLHLAPLLANIIRIVISTQVQFCLHRSITWRGQHTTPWRQQWYRYHLTKAISSGVNMAAFYVCVDLFDWNYMVVYVATVTILGFFNFGSGSKYIFTDELEKPKE